MKQNPQEYDSASLFVAELVYMLLIPLLRRGLEVFGFVH